MTGEIVETEAYIGPEDKASHAYSNRRTERTSVQFGERGHAYVFRIYGIYNCFCVVIGPRYVPAVALIRAIRPVEGVDAIRYNRNASPNLPLTNLTNGPSKLCQAFRILDAFNGIDLLGDKLFLSDHSGQPAIDLSARIGIDYAYEFKDVPWRFYAKGSPFVSHVPTQCRHHGKRPRQ